LPENEIEGEGLSPGSENRSANQVNYHQQAYPIPFQKGQHSSSQHITATKGCGTGDPSYCLQSRSLSYGKLSQQYSEAQD